MKILEWFKKLREPKYDLTFYDSLNQSWTNAPPVLAKDVKPLKQSQEKTYDEYKFAGCPGMFDYSRFGYIVPAWAPISIKANKAGTVAYVGTYGENALRRTTPHRQPKEMDHRIVDGTMTPDGVPLTVMNCPGPWFVKASPGVSALIFPAYYHNKIFADDIFVYPGVVDYNGFHVMNFVFSPRRPCEIYIKEGDPLLHVIPFITTRTFNAAYQPTDWIERNSLGAPMKFHENNFYRKYYLIKKKFTMTPVKDRVKYGYKDNSEPRL